MIAVFKTNVQKRKHTRQLLQTLQACFPYAKINFDLQDCDKILRIEDQRIATARISSIIHEQGFTCSELD